MIIPLAWRQHAGFLHGRIALTIGEPALRHRPLFGFGMIEEIIHHLILSGDVGEEMPEMQVPPALAQA